VRTGSGRRTTRTNRIGGPVLGVLVLVVTLALAACGSTVAGTATAPGQEPPPLAKITASPAVGAKNVPVKTPVSITVTDGELTAAKVTNDEGEEVAGAIAADRRGWTSSEALGFGRTYTYAASAMGADGRAAELTGAFDTVKPAKVARATINPADDATVGVGMPISVRFPDGKVVDRATVERALTVSTSVPVEGSWGWLHDQQVDWRPKEYWPANTEVTVTAKLYGIDYGGGVVGKSDLSTEFTIGRNQVTKVNTPDHVLNIYRDGNLAASYPSSNGKDADPELNTPNGTVIVMQKDPIGDFSNPRYGYTNVKKKWAVRISNHGEFIHENEENHANIGKVNSSHGCVNLFEADAKAYFDSALIGDPVEITGSVSDFPTTSDVNDWLFSWTQWQSKSALR